MPIYVPAEGPSDAKIALVGEAPGGEEERLGRPFSGPSGKLVDSCLESVGIPRESVYVTNVSKYRPPDNDIKKLHLIGKNLQDQIPQLWAEIEAIKPNVIIALGNTALEALTGERGIEHFRGSILPSLHGYPKVVPSLHPASILHGESDGKMRSWKDLTLIKWDFARAVEQSKFKELRLPQRNLIIARNSLDVWRFLERYQNHQYVSVDIETFRTIPICIGLAFNSTEAISIPLLPNNGIDITRSDLKSIWKDVADLLYNPRIFKIGQNFKFDQLQLDTCLDLTCKFGLRVNSFFFDTMLAFKTIYPELRARLELITSVLTEEPYYKEEGKSFNIKKDRIDKLLLYNAKDAVVTYEVYEKELVELEKAGLTDFFFQRIMPLHPFYSRLERRGILRDSFQQKFLREKYRLQEKELQEELEKLAECQINPNSPKQVAALLYGVLKVPARASTDEKALDALLRNAVKDPKKKRIIELILTLRKLRKSIGTYIDCKAHADGRIRTGYRLILETGRTSTSVLKPPVTTEPLGFAFQTATKHGDVKYGDIGSDIRSQYIPSPGKIFLEVDLSQAEARVVAILAEDKKLQKLFEYGVDIHRVTAGWIYNRSPNNLLNDFFLSSEHIVNLRLAEQINIILAKDITEYERQIGKMFRHAGHLGVGKRTAGENVGVSEWRAGEILKEFHESNPNIRKIFHEGIIEFLRNNNRILTSPHGRKRQFFNKWGEELFKEAYSFIPQATVSDHLKFAMIRIESHASWIEILEESHDSFLAEIYPEKLDEAREIIEEELSVPIDFTNCSLGSEQLVIPCEIKTSSTNWEMMEKVTDVHSLSLR